MPSRLTPTLLLTRPPADSRRLAALLPQIPSVIAPILQIVPVPHDAARLAEAEGLVFTSGHAVAAAGAGRGRPAFCVGPRTATLARNAGFEVIEGAGTSDQLRGLIAASGLRLLHPHGRHVASPLPVEGIVVYDQIAQPLTPAATELLAGRGPVVLPLASPRSARLLSQAACNAGAPLWLAAISPAAMAGWSGPAERRTVAASPQLAALATAIRHLCQVEQS